MCVIDFADKKVNSPIETYQIEIDFFMTDIQMSFEY